MRKALFCLGLVIAVGSLPASADEQAGADELPAPQKYTIKQTSPTIGTHIKAVILEGEQSPFDKRYSELTEKQKDTLRSDYKGMKDADEPPYPIDGLKAVVEQLAELHQEWSLRYKGDVIAQVAVDKNGNPQSASIIESPSKEITEMTAYSLLLQKYKPAVCGGNACAAKYKFHVKLVGPDESSIINWHDTAARFNGH